MRGIPKHEASMGKKLKKIQFVSRRIYEAMLSGQDLEPFLYVPASAGNPPTLLHNVLFQQGMVWASPQETSQLKGHRDLLSGSLKFWAVGTQPRVTVDRSSSQSELFAAGHVRFAQECGLFFLVHYADLSWKASLEKALYLMADTGIGGERSVGHGQFDLAIDEDFTLQQPDENLTNAFTTLSPYWPTQSEVADGVLKDAHYALINRRGWVTSPDAMGLRRQNVRMLKEGSVLHSKPGGALVDVNPLGFDGQAMVQEHDVWRYGLSFPVRCKLEG
jgi:CRISPR-associated protein Csm4